MHCVHYEKNVLVVVLCVFDVAIIELYAVA